MAVTLFVLACTSC